MSVIDDYLATINPAKRNELERIRTIIKEVAPETAEVISYRIPAFKVNGQALVYFALKIIEHHYKQR